MAKNGDVPSHTMELPRLIVIGNNNIGGVGKFLKSLDSPKKVSLVSGTHVKKLIQKKVEQSLNESGIKFVWHIASDNSVGAIKKF